MRSSNRTESAEFRADGSESASGQWRNGKLHGSGKIIIPSGDRYEGNFVDGKFSGLGTFTWADGSVFEGEFVDDKTIGLGVQWDKDGKVENCGRWADDKLVESCPVPRSKIPLGKFLSAAGESHCWAARAHSASSDAKAEPCPARPGTAVTARP